MSVKVAYSTTAIATGGRDGSARTTDGSFEVALALPKELGGNGKGNNPEQLFAAGYAACFVGAMKAVAAGGKHAKVPADATGFATVGIGPREHKGFGLTVQPDVSPASVDRAAAYSLVLGALEVCPYANATRGMMGKETDMARS